MHCLLFKPKVALGSAVWPPICMRHLLRPDGAVPLLPRARGDVGAATDGLKVIANFTKVIKGNSHNILKQY